MRHLSMILLATIGCHPDPSSTPADESASSGASACTFEGHPSVMKSPAFSMIVCALDAEGGWNAIEPKTDAEPGAKLAVRLKLHRSGFMYVFALSGADEWALLYPDAFLEETENTLLVGEFQVPPMDSRSPFFEVGAAEDCSGGEEKIIVLFSEDPLPETHPLSELVAPVREAGAGNVVGPEDGAVAEATEPEDVEVGAAEPEATEPVAVATAPKAKRRKKKPPKTSAESRAARSQFTSDLDAPPGERPLFRPRPTGSIVDVRPDDEGIASVAFSYHLVSLSGAGNEGCPDAPLGATAE